MKKELSKIAQELEKGTITDKEARKLLLGLLGVGGSASRKPNPYQLVCYKRGWSKTRIEKNNAKYWQFEIEHNGLRLP